MHEQPPEQKKQLKDERWQLLEQVNILTDKPMLALSFVWLALLILDFTTGLSPFLQVVSYVIWALFAIDFVIEFIIAPHKGEYLQRNWLTAVSLLLPALRLVRVFRALRVLRAARAVRSVSLIRLITSLNRGMRAIGRTLGKRGVGYVVALTVIVTFAGAAGMYTFESPQALCDTEFPTIEQVAQRDTCTQQRSTTGEGLGNYGEAVWWTAMIMTTMGSEYWPKTIEGRILGWLLSLYAFAIFGYITATIASYFVGQDAAEQPVPIDPAAPDLQTEIAALRAQLTALTVQLAAQQQLPVAAPDQRRPE